MYAVTIRGCEDTAYIVGEPIRMNSGAEFEEYKATLDPDVLVIYGTREHLLMSTLGLEDADFGTKEELLFDVSGELTLITEDK